MTAITRELLDAVIGAQGLTSLEHDLASALRRVLDVCDERDDLVAEGEPDPILTLGTVTTALLLTTEVRAALAGTQTEAVDS